MNLAPRWKFKFARALAVFAGAVACHTPVVELEPPVTGLAVGLATEGGAPAAGRKISATVYIPDCACGYAGGGTAFVATTGRYFINAVASASAGPHCVRISFPSTDGRDSLVVTRTLDFRTHPPYDSVVVDFVR